MKDKREAALLIAGQIAAGMVANPYRAGHGRPYKEIARDAVDLARAIINQVDVEFPERGDGR